ncbi:MAG: oligoendopeptidase F [Lachnospiraceae bacterium]|nr:oligoendopeptidase F [Lachnospiraceae bacterium]
MSQKTLSPRKESDPKYTWKIEDIYMTNEAWQKDFETVSKKLPSLKKFKGTLTSSAANLLICLKAINEVSLVIDKLYVYSNMRFHEDSTNAFYQALSEKAEMLLIRFASETAFITPEIAELTEAKAKEFLASDSELNIYSHFILNILRKKDHTLSPECEELLAKTGEISEAGQSIFIMLNDADMKFGAIKDENGEKIELTKGRYVHFLENADRRVRKDAFNTLYDAYIRNRNTIAAAYSASVKKDVFYASARKYASSLEMALADDNIPASVYSSLIDTVHKNIGLMHRYVKIRKKLLNLPKLHMYDLYAPLVPEAKMVIPFEEAKKTVLSGLKPMGDEYVEILKKGMEGGWLDVYENIGKRGGAYSWGTYSVHPFVLLNHNDNINSLFTLAHEMGHALHSYYSWKEQPYVYSGHKIFVAEVASTVNEALLMDYMLKNSKDAAEKIYIINYFLEQFRGTLFRQTMFAEFEKKTHELSEAGEILTCDALSGIYRSLNEFYFGNDIIIDEKIDMEWARIPHFYNAFYVYQYATGYSAAIAISRMILDEGAKATKRYKDFLKKGSAEYSVDLLKGVGVDMSRPEPVENAMRVFESLLDELESI